jgi:hypothetical protein
MADELEYIVNTALTHCDKGMAMLPFTSTINTTVHIQKQLVATEMDKAPLVNIPSYGMCSATKSPCNPVPTIWENTYEFVKVKTFKPLLFKSCMQCGKGGKIEFLTSGQLPLADSVDAESLENIEDANKQSQEAVEEFEAQKNAVGESGLAEGFIPVWGSGRDAINSFQTGHWGWGIFHSVMAVKGVVKAGVKATLKQAGKAALEGLTKKAIAAIAAKEAAVALIKNTGKMAAEFSVKRLGVCIAKACFVAGTPVATKDGLKNIEDLVSGDEVWAYNEHTGETALKPILNAFEREADVILKLIIDDEEIETTPEHPFFVDGEWKEAGIIEVGDTVQLLNGKAAVVKNIIHKFDYELQPTIVGEDEIEEEYKLTKVFNIEVADWHTYFVGFWKFLVHNAVCVRKTVENLFKYGRDYLKQIASITGRKIHPKQLAKIKEALRNGEFTKLSKEATAASRAEFNKVKDKLIKDWEKETGQKWPRYEKDILSKKGEVYLKKGDAYDAHHIIENTHGGPHEWWNIHPASNPIEHQAGIHGKDGISKLLFGN